MSRGDGDCALLTRRLPSYRFQDEGYNVMDISSVVHSNLLSDSQHNRQVLTHTKEMADKVPDLRAAGAEFAGYIADKNTQ